MDGIQPRFSATRSSGETQTDGLLRSLQCHLCNNRLCDPKECDCGHVFCADCLRAYVDNESHKIRNISCPICAAGITIPQTGVDDLPTHVFYKDLSAEVSALDNCHKLSRGSCKFCTDDDKLVATVMCETCKVPMCDECSSNHVHNGINKVLPIHRNQDSILCDVLPKRDTACNIHSTESLLLFCMQCNHSVCCKCQDESHSDHPVKDMADTAQAAKQTITDVHNKLNDYLNETKDALNDIERISKEFLEKVSDTESHIESQVDLLLSHILKEKEQLMDNLDAHSKDIQNRLNNCRSEIQSKDSRARAIVDLADNLLHFGNDAENSYYKNTVNNRWNKMQEEKLNRLGQGYNLTLLLDTAKGLEAMMSMELGTFDITQKLSPWTSRRSKPFDISPFGSGPIDESTLIMRVKSASNDYSMKRSQIFAKFVDPKWNLETYKINRSTGQTVAVWLKVDDDQEQLSRASKRLSVRTVSTPCISAEVESFNEKGELEYRKSFEKLPDGTLVRLAIGGKNTIMLAVYPGLYASSVIGHAKLKTLSKKDTDGIYVAVLEKGMFVCGELRKIPIPEGPGFDFDITGRGMIVVKPFLHQNLRLYTTKCVEQITSHEQNGDHILKITESPESDIVAMIKDKDGNVVCETIMDDGTRIERFSFPVESLALRRCEFREARFDQTGNMFIHFQEENSGDKLYQVTRTYYRKEQVRKPEMMHKVDKLAVLSDGRLCVFDKAECVLMTLRYL